MKIMKFGGTSVGSVDAIRQATTIIKNEHGAVGAVVVSAFTNVTDQLLAMAQQAMSGDASWHKTYREVQARHQEALKQLVNNPHEIEKQVQATLKELESILWGIQLVRELTPKMHDVVASFGERLSAMIIAACLTDQGIPSAYIDARELIVTTHTFGHAPVMMKKTQARLSRWWKAQQRQHLLPVITGFIGATENKETTTLGRGGSDYTAAIIGAAIDAKTIEIWTDVDGVMTADPRKVKQAQSIDTMTYEEAMELSHFGAKVIYPPTMRPAMEKNIPIVIKNTFHPSFPGTIIGLDSSSQAPIKGISALSGIALLQLSGSGMVGIPGVAARLFGALAAREVNIIMITQASSEHTICFAILPQEALRAKQAIADTFKQELRDGTIDPVSIKKDRSIIAVVGEHMRHQPGISGKVFTALGEANVNIEAIAQGSSERNISLVIKTASESTALQALHQIFFMTTL